MSGITVNKRVFSELEDNLLNVSTVIDHVSYQVGHICEGLPEGIKDQVDDFLNQKIMGILATCHCVKALTAGMSDDIGDLRYWAEKTNLDVVYEG